MCVIDCITKSNPIFVIAATVTYYLYFSDVYKYKMYFLFI